jgi:hypothetical protein
MSMQTTHRRMSGGAGHEHITNLRCLDEAGKAWNYQVSELVTYIETNGNNSVWCGGKGDVKSAWLQVKSNGSHKYVQTVADGYYSNNLLALPTF